MELLSTSIQEFVKSCLLQLATNTKIEHRNYASRAEVKPSPLVESVKVHEGNFNRGIKLLCDSIASNPEVIEIIKKLTELHSAKEDDNCDEIYDLENELFHSIIELTGLFEIKSLHGDDVDQFKEKFLYTYIYENNPIY